jgi:hypothetical protein
MYIGTSFRRKIDRCEGSVLLAPAASYKTMHGSAYGPNSTMVEYLRGALMLTEAEILSEVIQPGRDTMPPAAAREILTLRFRDETTSRIRELLARNNAGVIDPAEQADLEKYLRVGQLVDMLQAKARLSLAAAGKDAP